MNQYGLQEDRQKAVPEKVRERMEMISCKQEEKEQEAEVAPVAMGDTRRHSAGIRDFTFFSWNQAKCEKRLQQKLLSALCLLNLCEPAKPKSCLYFHMDLYVHTCNLIV
jgi:hypothetical protein